MCCLYVPSQWSHLPSSKWSQLLLSKWSHWGQDKAQPEQLCQTIFQERWTDKLAGLILRKKDTLTPVLGEFQFFGGHCSNSLIVRERGMMSLFRIASFLLGGLHKDPKALISFWNMHGESMAVLRRYVPLQNTHDMKEFVLLGKQV